LRGLSPPTQCTADCEATCLYVQAILTCQDFLTGLLHLLLGPGDCNKLADDFCYAGLFSWWVMQGGPDRGVPGVVWAVEPLPANLTVLQTNLEQHGLVDHVSTQQRRIAEYLPLCLACPPSYTQICPAPMLSMHACSCLQAIPPWSTHCQHINLPQCRVLLNRP